MGEEIDLQLPGAKVLYYPQFVKPNEADKLFKSFQNTIPWQQDDIKVFGKTYQQPRLTAFFGNGGYPYSYSNITMQPHAFTDELKSLLKQLETLTEIKFNCCLANFYRDGKDSNGWHADNEKELGENPPIASISLGEARYFHLKHNYQKDIKRKILLEHGSLLLMTGATQHNYKHQIPKTQRQIAERINLTFRIIR